MLAGSEQFEPGSAVEHVKEYAYHGSATINRDGATPSAGYCRLTPSSINGNGAFAPTFLPVISYAIGTI